MHIDTIISKLANNSNDYNITLYPGATDEMIVNFERALNIQLPDDIKKLYQFSNGFESEEDQFRIIPLDEILERKERYTTNHFYIAEYMLYCDIWDIEIDFDKTYTIFNIDKGSGKLILTDSLALFLERFLIGGVFETGGLYDWHEEIKNS